MGFVEAVKTVLSKYFVFSGRATRPEYWYFTLFVVLSSLVAQFCDTALGTTYAGGHNGLIRGVVSLALVLPHLAVAVRRLHDTDHSGWWLGGIALCAVAFTFALVALKPLSFVFMLALIGLVLLQLLWLCSAGTPGPNRYGPPPPTAVNVVAPIVPE